MGNCWFICDKKRKYLLKKLLFLTVNDHAFHTKKNTKQKKNKKKNTSAVCVKNVKDKQLTKVNLLSMRC